MSQSGRFERLEKERPARDLPAAQGPSATESRFASLLDARPEAAERPPGPSEGHPGESAGAGAGTSSTRSGCEPIRFEPPPPQSEELRVLDTDEQCFVRCADCRFDNFPTATRCRHCQADLTTPAQRSFNESFWRKRTEEEAEEAREVEALRLRRQEADREDAAALRQLMELERQWTIRRTFGLPWDERHGIVRVFGAGGRWAGEAFGGWLWRTFPRRSSRVLFMVALCLGLVGVLYALLPARLLPWVLAGAAVPTLLAWVRERFRGRE